VIKNYLLITLRNLRRNPFFSAINIAGLAIGLSACFLIWQYVRFESSYDSFNKNADRLYRVPLEIVKNSTKLRTIASSNAAVAHAMKEEFPEVEDFCRLVKTSLFTSDLGHYYANALEFSSQDNKGKLTAFNEENVWFADPGLLTMFTFPLIGGKEDALKEPNSVVLTERMAKKYFGNTNPVGQQMRLNREMVLNVTGVIKDVPENSHLQFDILISFSTMLHNVGDLYDNWGWNVFYSYVLLKPGADARALQAKLPALKLKYLGPEDNDQAERQFALQPIRDIHLRSNMDSEQSPVSSERTVYFLSILAVFILGVAWINYINLSTAKAMERSKEVGLRKTVGATRPQLILQFLFDTIAVNLFALLIAVVLVTVTWSSFESLIGKQIQTILYTGGSRPWMIATLVFVSGIAISGLYPALTLSSFSPAKVLKGKFYQSVRGIGLRKAMISFQYVLAVLLIAGTITIYLQLHHMKSMDTGFTKEQVVVIEAPAVFDSAANGKINFFKTEGLKVSGVNTISATSDVPGRAMVEGSPIGPITAKDNSEFFFTSISSIDTSFFSVFDIHLVDGRLFTETERMNFRQKDKEESIPIVVNEEFVKQLSPEDQKNVLNLKMTFFWGPEQRFAKVIGVVSSHHQVSFKEKVSAVAYVQPNWHSAKYFAVQLEGGSNDQVNKLKQVYANAFPDVPFTYFFLDQYFDRQYREDQQFEKIFNVFTALAIIVTCLGLLGLSVFSVTQRTKEVGIRKVLGAPSAAILFLFSRDFIQLLIISCVIAAPIIYWGGNQWLNNFAFRIPMQWQIFVLPPLVLSIITMTMIIAVSIRAAIETPVRALRQE
jgi:putative ABC transport system permease protein